jgi:hypothetical protein
VGVEGSSTRGNYKKGKEKNETDFFSSFFIWNERSSEKCLIRAGDRCVTFLKYGIAPVKIEG